jgi:DNA invertase Pin-like site-specific DNA recombinase
MRRPERFVRPTSPRERRSTAISLIVPGGVSEMAFTTSCLGRNLRHSILLPDEVNAIGVAFVSLGEGIDTAIPAGRLQLHVLGAIAEFERARIQERVRAGQARVRAQGRTLGRPRVRMAPRALQGVAGLSVREAALALGLSRSTVQRRMKEGRA